MGSVVLENIEKRYDEKLACTDINLQIKEGEFFTFLGPSGCGKTTILRLIAGFIKPDNGSIYLGGVDITSLAPEKRNVGMVFQNYALFPFMTVRENIEYGLKVQKKPKKEISKKTHHYLTMVGLSGLEDRNVSALSGGEQQRVAFARSLAIEPKVLLLDEPLSNLDARLRDSMRTELKKLQKQLGITTIFVTHDQTEALTMSDTIAVFNGGRCIQTGTPEDIYQRPADSFVAEFIGETNLFQIRCEKDQYYLQNNIHIGGTHLGTAHYVSIRPQRIKLSIEKTEGCISVNGVIKEKQYNGVSIEFNVLVKGLLFCVLQLNLGDNVGSYSIGQDVFVNFSSADFQLLER